jgi:hypothetical protein
MTYRIGCPLLINRLESCRRILNRQIEHASIDDVFSYLEHLVAISTSAGTTFLKNSLLSENRYE